MKHIENFLAGKRPNTARCYRGAIAQLQKLLGTRDLTKATPQDAARYLAWLKANGASDNTIRNRCRALQSVYSYLLDIGVVRLNPVKAAKRTISWSQQIQVRPTQLIESDKIRDVLNRIPLNQRGIRDRAIIAVLFGGGLRRSEALPLTLGDIRVSEQPSYLYLSRTKAGRARKQPMPQWAWAELIQLVTQRSNEGAGTDDPVFCFYYKNSSAWRPLSEASFYRAYKSYFGTGCHSARATFATKLLELGYPDREVARAMGHATTNQVQVYDKRRKEVSNNVGALVSYEVANSDDFAVDANRKRA